MRVSLIGVAILALLASGCIAQTLRADENASNSKTFKKINELYSKVRGELYDKNTHFTMLPPKFDH